MCGFRDAAHFSRSFREKFGQSPKDFRQSVLKTAVDLSQKAVRGWPARAALKNVALKEAAAKRTPVSRNSLATETSPRSHYLSATADTVHWGYFSRSLPPVMEVASGDFITIETLTQHAYDDYERMIKGDAGAESVFEWTPAGKRIDRRGAGPQDASIYGRGPDRSMCAALCPVTCWRFGCFPWSRGRRKTRPSPGARSAAMPRRGGAFITRSC